MWLGYGRNIGESLAAEPMTDRIGTGEWDLWPWTLMEIVPAATGAAASATPAAMLWHFQLAGAPPGVGVAAGVPGGVPGPRLPLMLAP